MPEQILKINTEFINLSNSKFKQWVAILYFFKPANLKENNENNASKTEGREESTFIACGSVSCCRPFKIT